MNFLKQKQRAAIDRACKITAFRCQWDEDEKIMRAMMDILGKPWQGRTPEQEEELEEEIASRATCPKGEGALAVWCEKDGA